MTAHTHNIADSLHRIREQIEKATLRRGPGPEVTLIGVSKRHPVEAIQQAYEAGLRSFGENYAQEFRDKAAQCEHLAIDWHFIGQLQSNKLKYVEGRSLLHTIDRPSLVDALEKRGAHQAATTSQSKLQEILIEINFQEEQKGGILPDQAPSLVEKIANCSHVRCRGLMTIPPKGNESQTRGYFAQTLKLLEKLAPGHQDFDRLSMGMSADYEWAIYEGATHVRVGTAIFGTRPTSR